MINFGFVARDAKAVKSDGTYRHCMIIDIPGGTMYLHGTPEEARAFAHSILDALPPVEVVIDPEPMAVPAGALDAA